MCWIALEHDGDTVQYVLDTPTAPYNSTLPDGNMVQNVLEYPTVLYKPTLPA